MNESKRSRISKPTKEQPAWDQRANKFDRLLNPTGLSGVNNASEKRSHYESAYLFRLAKAIQSRREKLQLSVDEVATRVELSPADIQAFEEGSWDMDVLSLIAIAEYLDINLNELFASVDAGMPQRKK